MKFITALVAIAQAVPIVNSWIEKLLTAWATYKVDKMQGPYQERSKQRHALMKAISSASNDEERLALSVVLHKLENGGLE